MVIGLRKLDPRRSLRVRLGFSLAALSLVFTILTGIFFGQLGDQRERDVAGATLAEQAFHAADKIDQIMVERYRDLEVVSAGDLFRNAAPYASRRALLETMQNAYRYYTWLGLLDTKGKVVVGTGGLLEGADFSREPLFTQAQTHVFMAEGEINEPPGDKVSDLVEGPTHPTMVSAPVFDANGNFAGVIGAYVDWDWTQDITRTLSDSPQGNGPLEMFVLGRDNYVLLGTPDLVGTHLNVTSTQTAQDSTHNYVQEKWPDGREYLSGLSSTGGYEDFPGLGWKVLVRQDAYSALAVARKFEEIQAWFGLAMGIMWALAGWMLARRMAGPMISIANAANRIRKGKSTVIPKVKGRDEVAMLASSLNEMVGNITNQEQELKALNDEMGLELDERKRIEEALRDSEEKYRAFVAYSSEGIMRVEADAPIPTNLPADEQIELFFKHGYLAECNDVMAQMYDFASSDEIMGARLGSVFARTDEINAMYLQQFVRSGYRLIEAESCRKDRDGNDRHFSNSFVGVVQDGKLVSVWGTQRDITERKAMQTALQELEIKFRSVAESATDVIASLDTRGNIVQWNHAAEVAFGYSEEEMLGKSLSLIVPDNVTQLENWQRALARPEEWEQVRQHPMEMVGLRRDGSEFPIELSIASWEMGTETFYTAIVRDITERKRAEESRLAREAAEKASRAKSEFLSRMSHELRTPLNSILGFGQLLQMDELTQSQEESIGYIMGAGKHLLGLINEILDISRIELGHMKLSLEPVEIAPVIEECLDLVRPMAGQRQLHIDTGEPYERLQGKYVFGDQQKLRQVLLNLLSNAIKYNSEGGSIKLRYEECTGRDDKHMRISITDTGFGIQVEELPRLFSPFERLDAERQGVEGTGLGLVLAKRLIEAMGGTIGVESIVGKGSTFWIELPMKDGEIEARANEPDLRITSALNEMHLPEEAKTLLYVEDNLANMKLVERIVERVPQIRLLAATRGSRGIEMAREYRPDLIFLDMNLPDMSGREVIAELKQDIRTGSIPVVIITADGSESQMESLALKGVQAYLTKPFNVKELLEVLQALACDKVGV